MSQYKIKGWWKNILLKKMLKHDVPEVDAKDAYQKQHNIIFFDSREKEEYEVSHLPNAVFVGFNDFKISALQQIEKDTPLIVYCAIGWRSEKITRLLIQEGYTNVQNLYGGIFEWINLGFEVVGTDGIVTNKIHVYNKKFSSWVNKAEKIY